MNNAKLNFLKIHRNFIILLILSIAFLSTGFKDQINLVDNLGEGKFQKADDKGVLFDL